MERQLPHFRGCLLESPGCRAKWKGAGTAVVVAIDGTDLAAEMREAMERIPGASCCIQRLLMATGEMMSPMGSP